MDDQAFLKLGNVYTKTRNASSKSIALRRYKAHFGATPRVCTLIWQKIKFDVPNGGEPKHLLWSLNFLKQNSVEEVRHSLFMADEKTVRKWTWIFIELLSNLNMIIWEERFEGAAHGQTCFCSLDDVDCKIHEPAPFSPAYYSHKFRAAGLRYEIGLNIRTGYIVWIHGGYPCGLYPDFKLAREAFVSSLETGERAVGDKGYKDPHFILKNQTNWNRHELIMSRHETVNRRFKSFRILGQVYRHSLTKHPMIFHAVANVVQLLLKNGHPLFPAI